VKCPKCKNRGVVQQLSASAAGETLVCVRCTHTWYRLPPAVRRAFAAYERALNRADYMFEVAYGPHDRVLLRSDILRARRARARAEGKQRPKAAERKPQ
jgi:hypothetical protein